MERQAPRLAKCAAGLAIATLLAPLPAAGDEPGEPWLLRHADPSTQTTVHTRDRGDAPTQFRAVTRLRVRLSALTAVLLDTERMPQWVYRTREALSLESSTPSSGIALVVTAMPWPLNDREAVVAWRLQQHASTGEVVMEGHSAPDRAPPAPGRVRMPTFESRWRFMPLETGEVQVSFEGEADLGGNLGHPLLRDFVRSAAWQAPLQTIEGLRHMVLQAPYRDAVLDFVREPDAR